MCSNIMTKSNLGNNESILHILNYYSLLMKVVKASNPAEQEAGENAQTLYSEMISVFEVEVVAL